MNQHHGKSTKVVFAVLAVTLMVAASAAVVFGTDEDSSAVAVEGIEYKLIDDKAVVLGFESGKSVKDLTIPSVISVSGEMYDVTEINNRAFADDAVIERVYIGSNLVTIKADAFSGCCNISYLHLGNSVESIMNCSFLGCSSLKAVSIPDSVTEMRSQVFMDCTSLSSLSIGRGLTSMGSQVFKGCTGLKEVDYEAVKCDSPGMTAVFEGAGSPDGMKAVFGDSVEVIGRNLFSGSNVTSVQIGNGVARIADCAFEGCEGLASVVMPDSVTIMGHSVFRGCTGLSSVRLSQGITHIGEESFQGCISLASVAVPMKVTVLKQGMFEGCTSLTEVSLPDGLKTIEKYAFRGCSALEEISFVSGLQTIGESAFEGCVKLRYAIIPGDVMTISTKAFYGCTALETVYLSGNQRLINSEAFGNCPNIEAIVFGEFRKDVSIIGDLVFTKNGEQRYLFTTDSQKDVIFRQDNVNAGKFDKSGFWIDESGSLSLSTLVIFDPNGGSCGEVIKWTTPSRTIEGDLPIPVRDSYVFKGWFDADGRQVTEQTKFYSASIVTAKWEVEKHTVTFVNDKGKAPASQILDYGSKVAKPSDPTARGFTFDGWYDGDRKWDFEKDVVTSDVTLTAKWISDPAGASDISAGMIAAFAIAILMVLYVAVLTRRSAQ